MKIDFKASPVFEINLKYYKDDNYRILCNQGGTRSGKTYSIVMLCIFLCLTVPGLSVSVVSESLPHLKRGAIKDFMEIMDNYNLYNVKQHNKTDLIYRFDNKSYIEFFSADNGDKLRGSGRDLLFINEVNNLKKDSFIQLNMRTKHKVIIDYNPADEFHWLYDDVIPRDDCKFIKSTYLNNVEFLPKELVNEIERLKLLDENYWKVYGLGERGTAQEVIYTSYDIISNFPDTYDFIIYGMDFGFNNPSSIVQIGFKDNIPYVKELLYESGLTNPQLIEKAKTFDMGNDKLYADCAEPARIEEFKRAKFNIDKADKSVEDGIDHVKQYRLKIDKNSTNLIKEIRSYKYMVKNEIITDSPVKYSDHLMDAMRYAMYTYYAQMHEPKAQIRWM